MANKTLFGKEAREALFKGITTVHDAVAMSIGARGRNAVYRHYSRPKITNDGVSIARKIDPEDEFEKMGADLIKESAEMTDSEAGDGTTTSTVLAYALIQEGMAAIELGADPMRLRMDMEAAKDEVLKKLDDMKTDIKTHEQLEHIAMVSVEDEKLGKMIADAAKRAGVDGSVIIEEHDKAAVEREDVEGYRVDGGLMSPYFVTNPERMEAVLEGDVPILVTDKTWNQNTDLVPLVENVIKAGYRKMVVVAEEVSGELLATLVQNSMRGAFQTIVVKKPFSQESLDDIAAVTGATPMTREKGIVEPQFAYFGWATKVIANKNSCTIIGGKGDKESVDKRIVDLKALISKLDGYDKAKAKERLSKLTTGVTLIKIGAPTSSERGYLRLKAEDAAKACKAALEDGILPGGGVALRDASYELEDSVVARAIRRPFELILKSASVSEGDSKWGVGVGIDAKTGLSSQMIPIGVIDPAKVTKTALKNAVSLAGIFLTTEVAIADIPEEKK